MHVNYLVCVPRCYDTCPLFHRVSEEEHSALEDVNSTDNGYGGTAEAEGRDDGDVPAASQAAHHRPPHRAQ